MERHIRQRQKKSPFIVLSKASGRGFVTRSPKGDTPGFLYVQDQKTLFIPDRPGNKLIDRHKNIIENPNIELIFFVSNIRETLRINGKAELRNDPELLNRLGALGKPASLVTKITVGESSYSLKPLEPRFLAGTRKDLIWRNACRHPP